MENIIFTNGVKNSLTESIRKRDVLSKLMGRPVYLHHNPSMNLFTALIESAWSRWLYWIKPVAVVKRLAIRIEDAIIKNRDKPIYVIGHSQGCVISMNAVRLLRPRDRERVRAIMFAPTNTQEPCGGSVEYWLNNHDWVISHLIKPKWKKGPVYKREGKGHSLDKEYLDVIKDFKNYENSLFWWLIKDKGLVNEKSTVPEKPKTKESDHTTNEDWME